MKLISSRRALTIGLAIALAGAGSAATAGTFLKIVEGENRIVHPRGYAGNGGERVVTVCLDEKALPLSGDPAQAIQNAVDAYNAMTPVLGNVADNPNGGPDFESVLLHEIGHCVGMDHNALGSSETGSGSSPHLYFANAFKGADGVFNTDAAADGVRGSRDDIRGDDVNRNWFRKNVNNPFELPPAIVDRQTHSMLLGDLPGGHTYVENSTAFACSGGQPNTSGLRGHAPTQNTMFPTYCTSTVLRQLAPDDVTTLRIARAGLDGTQGTSDDYTLRLDYVGEKSDCDIKIQFTNDAGFALCNVGATSIVDSSDWTITTATAKFQNTVDWFYNQTASGSTPDVGPTISANTPANNSTTSLGGGAISDQVNGSITFTVTGGSGNGTTSLQCSVSSGTVSITSNASQTIAVGGSANAVGVRFTLTSSAQTGVVGCTATPQGGTVANFSYTFTADAGSGGCADNPECVFHSGFEAGEG